MWEKTTYVPSSVQREWSRTYERILNYGDCRKQIGYGVSNQPVNLILPMVFIHVSSCLKVERNEDQV